MYIHHVCYVPEEVRKELYPLGMELLLWAAMEVLGVKPQSSGRTVYALNFWTVSLVLKLHIKSLAVVCLILSLGNTIDLWLLNLVVILFGSSPPSLSYYGFVGFYLQLGGLSRHFDNRDVGLCPPGPSGPSGPRVSRQREIILFNSSTYYFVPGTILYCFFFYLKKKTSSLIIFICSFISWK